MNELFIQRVNEYFGKDADKYIKLLNYPNTQGFFINTNKASKEDIFDIIDFDYQESNLTTYSFYHSLDNIGKTKAYELGLIYPQEIAASIPSTIINTNNVKLIIDLCAAPGGKSINILNKVSNDAICVCNDISYKRSLAISNNMERLGLDNVVITNKKIEDLTSIFESCADLVILDAPCSGEGIVRKYPEILDSYSTSNIIELSNIQADLLENAYRILKKNGQLIYSTCTYSFEEDEHQIQNFIKLHPDMEIIDLGEQFSSTLKGTIKFSPLNNTEGQFICLMRKKSGDSSSCKLLKPIRNNIIERFISDNLNLDSYYIYKNNNMYYLSLIELPDLSNNVIKYGIYLGDIKNDRFEPNHNLYRANSLKNKYKYTYDLSDDEYNKFVQGLELKAGLTNNYYLVTYKGHSLGYCKCSNNILKNKYPKGLRRML